VRHGASHFTVDGFRMPALRRRFGIPRTTEALTLPAALTALSKRLRVGKWNAIDPAARRWMTLRRPLVRNAQVKRARRGSPGCFD
jgi:hypothetical protein